MAGLSEITLYGPTETKRRRTYAEIVNLNPQREVPKPNQPYASQGSTNEEHNYCLKDTEFPSLLDHSYSAKNEPKHQNTLDLSKCTPARPKTNTSSKCSVNVKEKVTNKLSNVNAATISKKGKELRQTFMSDILVSSRQKGCTFDRLPWPKNILSVDGDTYQIMNVPGDGNCFFHAISLFEEGSFSNTLLYRHLICNEVVHHFNMWKEEFFLFHDTCKSLDSYRDQMVNGSNWATVCEIKAACLALDAEICVYLVTNNNAILKSVYSLREKASSKKVINLLLHNNHFQLLKDVMPNSSLHGASMTTSSTKKENKPDTFSAYNSTPKHSQCKQQISGRKNKLMNIVKRKSGKDISKISATKVSTKSESPEIKKMKCIPQNEKESKKQNKRNKIKTAKATNYMTITEKNLGLDNQSTSKNKFITNTKKVKNFDEMKPMQKKKSAKAKSQKSEQKPIKIENKEFNDEVDKTKEATTNKKSTLDNNVMQRNASDKKNVPSVSLETKNKAELNNMLKRDLETQSKCRKVGIIFEAAKELESKDEFRNREKRNLSRLRYKLNKFNLTLETIPEEPPLSGIDQFDKTMDHIRSFELLQMSYEFKSCKICMEKRLGMKMHSGDICHKCFTDKNEIKMFSKENEMHPGIIPHELQNLTMIEQQLIARISPCVSVYMLKHGGLATKGHCVTFPQEVNEPAKLFPRLPHEIHVLKVKRQGQNETGKDIRVRRYTVQNALIWLKQNNPVYSDIEICNNRLLQLPLDDEIKNLKTCNFKEDTIQNIDKGPAPNQLDPDDLMDDCITTSGVVISDKNIDVKKEKEKFIHEILECTEENQSSKKTLTIPWPTRDNNPVSEFTTRHFFTLAFPTLFPYGKGDYYINRPRTCTSMSEWANHLMWYDDGRFAKHQVFKFIVHNMIIRRRTLENSNFIINQKLGEEQLSVIDLKEKIQNGDTSIGEKIVHFATNLRGTTQYWSQRCKELRALIQYKINEGAGLPSFFTTGSCAEFYFKPLKRLLQIYEEETTNKKINLDDKNTMFKVLQENTHIVADYFDKRTHDYFNEVIKPAFGVDTFWYRQEFAKSRGMIHWHGLCWRKDREPHSLLHDAYNSGLDEKDIALIIAQWAENEFKMTASHPSGKDENGQPRKEFWPPPEGTAPAPPDEKNPLVKLLMDVSESEESLNEDHLLLTNRINIHRCSDYCLRPSKSKKESEKVCRLEFGTASTPGKEIRNCPALVRDKNKCLRLEMIRDHPTLVQHSTYHTQGWRANGDISIILSKSGPENPSVDDIIATEEYITGYACKGGHGTGAIVDLFNDMVNSTDEDTNVSAKSICTKLLMQTTKRDISAVEAAFELSGLHLYKCSHSFQNVSMSGSRLLERTGSTLTKQTSLDKYLSRSENDKSSWYEFVCQSGYVPVVSGGNARCSWPLSEDYCRTMLLLHTPNWRSITELKDENQTWLDKFSEFLESDNCPNFVKADLERAKKFQGISGADTIESDDEIDEDCDRPEWADLLKPNPNFTECENDFQYDDGGPEFDLSTCTYNYQDDLGVTFLENLDQKSKETRARNTTLDLPEVDVSKLNEEQNFAFQIVLSTLLKYKSNPNEYIPLRMIVAGTAGSGKSYLIKCIVRATRLLFNSNECVQVLCPTGNSANLISGVTIHSFLKIPTSGKSKELAAPKGKTAEKLQSNCEDLEVLLVDERSLIGCTTLGWMEFMCSFGKSKSENSSTSWGYTNCCIFR